MIAEHRGDKASAEGEGGAPEEAEAVLQWQLPEYPRRRSASGGCRAIPRCGSRA